MTYVEASEWMQGLRSTINTIPQHPLETWEVRIAQADAAMMEQAYWFVKYYLLMQGDNKP